MSLEGCKGPRVGGKGAVYGIMPSEKPGTGNRKLEKGAEGGGRNRGGEKGSIYSRR
jgi:hypothetical protein